MKMECGVSLDTTENTEHWVYYTLASCSWI